jgi:acyl-CoA synthetase (AMP-forming)/AMP-acid ligase II
MPEFPLTTSCWLADAGDSGLGARGQGARGQGARGQGARGLGARGQGARGLGGSVLETTIGGILREAAGRAPDKVALIDGDPECGERRRWTYAALLADGERAARALRRRFGPGERVAVWSANSPEWIILEFAAALAGLTLVTVNPAYLEDELAHVLGHSAADGLFLADTYQGNDLHAILGGVRGRLPQLREVISFSDWAAFTAAGDLAAGDGPLPDVSPASAAQVLYTSGTTGRPKGAVLSHRGMTNNARLAFAAIGAGPDDVAVNPMPLFHVAGGELVTLGTVQVTGTQVIMPRFSPALQLELIETFRGTIGCGAPTMLIAILGHPDLAKRDVSSMRVSLTGGAVSPPALAREMEARLGLCYCVTFAQTESSCSMTVSTPADSADDRAETVGRPLPATDLRIADPVTGETVACGTIGEIRTRGYLVMNGYLNAPEATAAAVDADGWLRTGDLGSMDDRGYLRIAGRIKDMIIRGGENIYPREIEEVLIAHPAVADASVLGVPDEYYGEVVGAAIRPAVPAAPGAGGVAGVGGVSRSDEDLAAELADYCRTRLAAYKIPVRWLITDAFPLTASGKIRKDVLRKNLTDQEG